MLVFAMAGVLAVVVDGGLWRESAGGWPAAAPQQSARHVPQPPAKELAIPSLSWPPAQTPESGLVPKTDATDAPRGTPSDMRMLPSGGDRPICTMRILNAPQNVDPLMAKPATGRDVDPEMAVRSFCRE
jgi:hypothetical protein